MPPVESTRRLLGASFDLLARSSPEMRPASFYVGLVILGTVAPLALAAWATIVTDVQRTAFESMVVLGPTYEAWDTFLVWIAGVGFLVALIDARIIAVSLLGRASSAVRSPSARRWPGLAPCSGRPSWRR